jgi:hypothetical protein
MKSDFFSVVGYGVVSDLAGLCSFDQKSFWVLLLWPDGFFFVFGGGFVRCGASWDAYSLRKRQRMGQLQRRLRVLWAGRFMCTSRGSERQSMWTWRSFCKDPFLQTWQRGYSCCGPRCWLPLGRTRQLQSQSEEDYTNKVCPKPEPFFLLLSLQKPALCWTRHFEVITLCSSILWIPVNFVCFRAFVNNCSGQGNLNGKVGDLNSLANESWGLSVYDCHADTPTASDLEKALVNYLPVLLGFVSGGWCPTKQTA